MFMTFFYKILNGFKHTVFKPACYIMYISHIGDSVKKNKRDIILFKQFEMPVANCVFGNRNEHAIHTLVFHGIYYADLSFFIIMRLTEKHIIILGICKIFDAADC